MIALKAPQALQEGAGSDLTERIEALDQTEPYHYCLYSLQPLGAIEPQRWPAKGFLSGNLNQLADLIEQASLSERILAQSMDTLEEGVAIAARRLLSEDSPALLPQLGQALHQRPGEQTARMAMSIALNALTFQSLIAGRYQIKTADELRGRGGKLLKSRVLKEWHRILEEVNYWPIFSIACDLIRPLPERLAADLLTGLAETAEELAASGVTTSHDLTGRMFQTLISDRKFLATFYTRPASAALLAVLSLSFLESRNWAKSEALTSLRVGDLACGTGTLLVAAYQALVTRYRRCGGDDALLHCKMMEQSLIACDIMPAATHLTTSMLSSMHPTKIFKGTQIYTLPYGQASDRSGQKLSIGALELLDAAAVPDLFGSGATSQQGEQAPKAKDCHLPKQSLDWVIMKPPFTRPTNHAGAERVGVPVPSFAGFAKSEDEQAAMSKRLKSLLRPISDPASHGNAGLASNFLDLAHQKLAPGGVLSLVLPQSFCQGSSWAASRGLIARCYEKISIVSIAGERSEEKSFSADTGMGEILLIARRRAKDSTATPSEVRVRYVTLRQAPHSTMEAHQIAHQVDRAQKEAGPLRIGTSVLGTLQQASLAQGGCAAVLDLALSTAALRLEEGQLHLPRNTAPIEIPITTLGELGQRGWVDRDINGCNADQSPRGPFDLYPIDPPDSVPEWPLLWGHDAKAEHSLIVAPDRQGEVRVGMEEQAGDAWAQNAAQLHFNRDFRLNSQSLAACYTLEPCMGGTAWPSFLPYQDTSIIPLLLWANTTLGLLLFWWAGNRQQSGRARLTVSQLPTLRVLNANTLSAKQHKCALHIFDQFKTRCFLPANEAYRDKVRKALDAAVLLDLLGLKKTILEPLDQLRRKWCASPSVHGGKSTRIK